jgi:hypothetical protein
MLWLFLLPVVLLILYESEKEVWDIYLLFSNTFTIWAVFVHESILPLKFHISLKEDIDNLEIRRY